jgi:hypothetical protein
MVAFSKTVPWSSLRLAQVGAGTTQLSVQDRARAVGPVMRSHSGPEAALTSSSKVGNGQHFRSLATKCATGSSASAPKRYS